VRRRVAVRRDGVVLFEVMTNNSRSFPTDPDSTVLAERGVEQQPNPAVALPGWLEDTRR
jgi:hypothetical protein